jgi:hypothetical protein
MLLPSFFPDNQSLSSFADETRCLVDYACHMMAQSKAAHRNQTFILNSNENFILSLKHEKWETETFDYCTMSACLGIMQTEEDENGSSSDGKGF